VTVDVVQMIMMAMGILIDDINHNENDTDGDVMMVFIVIINIAS